MAIVSLGFVEILFFVDNVATEDELRSNKTDLPALEGDIVDYCPSEQKFHWSGVFFLIFENTRTSSMIRR